MHGFLALASFYSVAHGAFLTPAGRVSCAYGVPSGSNVEHHASSGGGFTVTHPDGSVVKHPPCRGEEGATVPDVGFKGGWQVYTKQDFSGTEDSIHSFVGSWNVPNAPAKYTKQTIFLFTGMQNEDWIPPDDGPKGKFDIIQPVLQYGPSGAGGGAYWMISSWYVPLGGLFDEATYSLPVRVATGDIIFGNMTRGGSSSFTIDSYVVGNASSHTSINVNQPRLSTQPWAYVAFESYADYDQLTCDEWPSEAVVFKELAHAPAAGAPNPFQWTAVQKDSICNASASIDGSNVKISF